MRPAATRAARRVRDALPSSIRITLWAAVALELETAPGILEALRGHGFHFGALIPGTGRGDVLRLQRIADAEIAPERIRLGSELGERVLSEVLRDREAVRAGG